MPLPSKRSAVRGSKYSKKIDPISFHVAYEGIDAEKEYFNALAESISKRFRQLIVFIPVPKSSTDSAPSKVVDDLVQHLDNNIINLNAPNSNHRGIIVIDTDHHFNNTHNKNTQEAMKLCRQKGIQVSITNPCFEVWLMCHFKNISEESDAFKEKLLVNDKHESSRIKSFAKVEYSRMKGEKKQNEIIKLIPSAIANEKLLNGDDDEVIPPIKIYSGVGKIIHQLIDSGFILNN